MDSSTNQHSAEQSGLDPVQEFQLLHLASADTCLSRRAPGLCSRDPKESPRKLCRAGKRGLVCAVSNLEEARLCCVCSVMQALNVMALCTDAKSVGAANLSRGPVSVC